MKTYTRNYEAIIAIAAREAGIAAGEEYTAEVLSTNDGLIEVEISTEWNKSTCYIDAKTYEVRGFMAEGKSVEEILWAPASALATAQVKHSNPRTA